MRKLEMFLGGALALAACSTTPATPPAPVDLTNPLMAPGYLAQAASSDMFEIQSGQLRAADGGNPTLQNFANMLVTDHTQSTQMLMSAAAAAHVPPLRRRCCRRNKPCSTSSGPQGRDPRSIRRSCRCRSRRTSRR